jgi:hypothetical protein
MAFKIPELDTEQEIIDTRAAYQQLKSLASQLQQNATTFNAHFVQVRAVVSAKSQAQMDTKKNELVQSLRTAFGR